MANCPACFSATLITGLISITYFFSFPTCLAQSPSTNTPVPPLQWIELTPLLSGSSPPGLQYSSMGFDATSRTLILFGGEANGIPVQQTYLLNTSSLTWSIPNPPSELSQRPPPRSAAISGADFAASNRHAFLVIGGKGLKDEPLNDAWEFDYNNEFWSQINISPGGPSARWGASGGADPLASPTQDPIVAGPNNTFYLAGGYDGSQLLPLSDVWTFHVAGVLSPNNPNDAVGSWTNVGFSDELPSKVRQGGIVMPSARVVAAGGCGVNEFTDEACAQQDAYVLNIDSASDISPPPCPAPRVGPVLVPNYNQFSTSFSSQTFMVLGLFDDKLWDDGGGLSKGEVDVLDIETGTWTRVLPSGDPGTSENGSPKFPPPREGAAAISSPFSLVGENPAVSSDTIIFGGRDASGQYLNDVWLLRAYTEALTRTDQQWTGYGDGRLQTGVNAAGAGVTVEYLTSCASALAPPPTSGNPSPSPTGSPSPKPVSQIAFPYDTDVLHKLLSPLSVGLLLTAIIFYRLSAPAVTPAGITGRRSGYIWLAASIGIIAYGIGVAGVVISFTTIVEVSSPNNLARRSPSSSLLLATNHGRAGLAFFVALYGLVPILFATILCSHGRRPKKAQDVVDPDPNDDQGLRSRKNSNDTASIFTALGGIVSAGREKPETRRGASPALTVEHLNIPSPASAIPSPASASPRDPPRPNEPRQRTMSWGGRLWPGYRRDATARRSSDSGLESMSSAGAARSFEVLNRGTRARKLSHGMNGYSDNPAAVPPPRSLSDLNWLDRRRSLNAVGELDYALTRLNANHRESSAPGMDLTSTRPLIGTPQPPPDPLLPPLPQSLAHIILHCCLLGACVVALTALWSRAPIFTFIITLVWVLAFYAALFILAWRGRPRESILTVLMSSLRNHSREEGRTNAPRTPPASRPLSVAATELYQFPSETRSPYVYHQPAFRRAVSSHEDELMSHNYHGSRPLDDEDGEDEETTQRRIEQEMDRRDVSIVTVPKRKLWIANPS